MTNKTSERLKQNKEKILQQWEERSKSEVAAALGQEKLTLRNSIPEYLNQLVNALSTNVSRSELRKKFELEESERIGRKHGNARAGSANYTIGQMIYEYHILRQVIFDILEEEAALTDIDREIIICSIEQAVNDAATQFSETLRDIQEYLTRTVAHDLRNPIAAAKMGSQLIQRKPNDADHSMKTAGRIGSSMDRLDSMIHDLLDASKLGAGESLPLKLEELDLDLIARQIADEFNYNYEDRFIVNSPGPIIGHWSKNGLSRIIENLATNAVKYGDTKAPITFNIEKKDHTVIFTVHNEGKPIPLEDQTILFQQYRRSKSAEGKEGWGIGLTLVKGLTESHHGKVSVVSEEGKGTSFTIELPLDSRVPVSK